MDDDYVRRRFEAARLQKMFRDSFRILSENEWRFEVRDSGGEVVAALTCYLPKDYPSTSSPTCILDSPLGVRIQQNRPAQGQEVGLTLASHFFDFCKENICGSTTASSGTAASAGATPQQPTEADATEDLINLSENMARHLSASLLHDGWQDYGPGMFVHGASGILVQIKDRESGRGVDVASILTHASQLPSLTSRYNLLKNVRGLCLHIKVDGVGADGNHKITEWARNKIKQMPAASLLPGERTPNRFTVGPQIKKFSFGKRLIQFALQVRDAHEAKYVSAEGRVDQRKASPPRKTRLKRYDAFKGTLQEGKNVAFRSSGNSLLPKIRSNECCEYQPVRSHDELKEGDIVFCQIKVRYWQHKVKHKTYVGGKQVYTYTISNAAGHVNGTTTLEKIYGKLIRHWM